MLADDAYLHWLDQCGFSDPARELVGQSVPIRYDPFDIGILYAFVQNQWIPCQSQFYTQLSGRSERELEIITAELRRVQRSDASSRSGIVACSWHGVTRTTFTS